MSNDQNPRVEMEVTIKFKYKTDPFNYREGDVNRPSLQEIAAIDTENFNEDPGLLFEIAEAEDYTVEIKPVTNH